MLWTRLTSPTAQPITGTRLYWIIADDRAQVPTQCDTRRVIGPDEELLVATTRSEATDQPTRPVLNLVRLVPQAVTQSIILYCRSPPNKCTGRQGPPTQLPSTGVKCSSGRPGRACPPTGPTHLLAPLSAALQPLGWQPLAPGPIAPCSPSKASGLCRSHCCSRSSAALHDPLPAEARGLGCPAAGPGHIQRYFFHPCLSMMLLTGTMWLAEARRGVQARKPPMLNEALQRQYFTAHFQPPLLYCGALGSGAAVATQPTWSYAPSRLHSPACVGATTKTATIAREQHCHGAAQTVALQSFHLRLRLGQPRTGKSPGSLMARQALTGGVSVVSGRLQAFQVVKMSKR